MSRLGINTGNNPNDGQGDPLRIAMGKINSNFQEIYNTFGDGTSVTSYASTAGISTVARNLTGNPVINVGGVSNTGITTTEHIQVRNITSTGVVTATQFVGDGSQLTNVTAVVGGLEVLDDNVRRGVARELNFGANIVSSGPDGVGRVTIDVSPVVLGTTGYALSAGYAAIAGIASTSTYLSDAANIITGTIDKNRISTTSALSVVGDLYVSGNISFGGTTTQLNTQQLQIADPDIVLGIGTSFGSTDNTANHGGIAIASTEGTPLVDLNIVPGETNPSTYKKIMWFKGDTIGAGLTDAWLFNYGVGIGSTQVPNGVRLAVGGVQITDTTVTATTFNGTVSSATYATSSGIATYSQVSGIATYAPVSGFSTYSTSSGISTYSGIANISGYASTAGIATYATKAGISTNVIGGIASVTALNVSGVSTIPTIAGVTNFTNTTDSTDKDSGAVIIEGGVGIEKRLNVGGSFSSYGNYANFGNNSRLQFDVGASDSPNVRIRNIFANGRIRMDSELGIDLEQYNNASAFRARFDDTNVSLYSQNNLKLQTIGAGVTVTGTTFTNQLSVSGISTFTGISTFQSTIFANQLTVSGVSTLGSLSVNQSTITPNTTLTVAGNLFVNDDLTVNAGYPGVGAVIQGSDYGGKSTGFYRARIDDLGSSRTEAMVIGRFQNLTAYTLYNDGSILTNGDISLVNGANLNVSGVITATDTRIQSVGEKTTVVSGNTVSLVYNTGGGNIAICTNPSGDITLNVTGIPTDTTFNNYSLTFSVIVSNTGTARSCTTVNLNGVSRTIKWFGGSLTAAISGVTTTTGYDIYNFTGINTVGSASTAANYIVFGSVNGGYR